MEAACPGITSQLRQKALGLGPQYILEHYPNVSSMVSKATFKYWTADEIETLESMWNNGADINDIADALDRSLPAIYTKVYDGLDLPRRGDRGPSGRSYSQRRWTTEEIAYLRTAWPNLDIGIKEILERLNRTEIAVRLKTYSLGLKRKGWHRRGKPARPWTDDDNRLLARMYEVEELHVVEIADKLGRSRTAVRAHASKLGMRRNSPNKAQLGFELGRMFFEQYGIRIIKEGTTRSAADFIVIYEGKRTAVNVKTGQCLIRLGNMRRLLELDLPIVFLWFPPGESPIVLTAEPWVI